MYKGTVLLKNGTGQCKVVSGLADDMAVNFQPSAKGKHTRTHTYREHKNQKKQLAPSITEAVYHYIIVLGIKTSFTLLLHIG